MKKLLSVASLLFALTSAFKTFEEDSDGGVKDGSYYESPVNSVREHSYDYGPSPLELYYDYRYGEYYGQTVAAIIFLDILLPIACCAIIIIVIVCIVRAARRNAQMNQQHQGSTASSGSTAAVVTYQVVPGQAPAGNPYMAQGGQPMMVDPNNPYAQQQVDPNNPYMAQQQQYVMMPQH